MRQRPSKQKTKTNNAALGPVIVIIRGACDAGRRSHPLSTDE
jgi:hypothetical protein